MPPARTPVSRVELLRRQRGWSQRQLAERAGTSLEVIGRIERWAPENAPSAKTAGAIA